MHHFPLRLKMRQQNRVGSLLFYSLLFLMAVGCGQAGELTLTSGSSELLGSDEFVLENVTACNEAAGSSHMQTLNQKITFEDTRVESGLQSICPFPSSGEDKYGNLTMKDGEMRSRYEQFKTLNLPANAVLCDVKLTNNLQRFRYDDVFFLTFNDIILATNNKSAITSRIQPMPVRSVESHELYNLYNYNWMNLRTARFNNVADDFCLGNDVGLGNCTWPVTEQPGQILLSWKPEVFIRLSSNQMMNNQTFKFVITGDNDASVDCYHEKLEFDINVKYYLK